jgi:hypothetical protein
MMEYRPKDAVYASLFDKKDLPSLYKLAEKVRTTHDQSLVDNFNLKCQQKWNDHNPLLGDNIEFLQVSKADDLVVNGGIDLCIDQILGTSVVRWRYMARGTGITTPAATDTLLTTEVGNRLDMSLFGWREYASSSLRFAGIYGETFPSGTYTEVGIFTTSGFNTITMLNKVLFSNFPLTHTINITGFVISCIIEFVPVM